MSRWVTNAMPGHAFTVVRIKEKTGNEGGFNYSREAMVKENKKNTVYIFLSFYGPNLSAISVVNHTKNGKK